ncbi:MAG: DUF3052 domain-containing protein [Gammaproteobacteria bacterium]|nr:DUF3052 domain-containing protein [Gammaproteobacteria bacterium]
MAQAKGAASASGYSGTPLARKLGIAPGQRLCVSGAPLNYRRLVALPAGVRLGRTFDAHTDLLHLFVTRHAELERWLTDTRGTMRPDAAIWVSWPKKSSGMASELTEDRVRALALPLQLVDVKVCAIDATWSALKLVIRREHRAPARP